MTAGSGLAAGSAARVTVLADCLLLNVFSGEITETDVTIVGNRIASIRRDGRPAADEILDCRGRYVVPGLIDAHMHVDTTFLWPGELARAIVPMGTTSLFIDSSNNAHTGGVPAITALRDAFAGLPLRGFVGSPSYCPFNAELGTAAVEMKARDFAALAADGFASIGETVWTRMQQEDEDFLRGVASFRAAGLRVSGHGGEIPFGDEAAFDAYVSAGVQDDHCIGRGRDIDARLRRGLRLFLVECTGRRGQLRPLLERMAEDGLPWRQACLSIDNNTAIDIVSNGFGYMDYLVRIALEAGVPPVEAYRMATLNAAEHHRMAGEIGGVAPGRLADLLVLDALDAFPPRLVMVDGQVVAREGQLVVDIPAPAFPADYMRSVRVGTVTPERFAVAATDASLSRQACRVIGVIDGDAFNTALRCELPVVAGCVEAEPKADILKIAVVERFGRRGTIGVGFVKGIGLRKGGMATSISVPFNNIVAVGATDRDLRDAVAALEAMQGGFVVVADGEVQAKVGLPIGGIMSAAPYERFLADTKAAEDAARALGCRLHSPFKTLVSTVHTTLPELGLTDLGLIDTRTGHMTSVAA